MNKKLLFVIALLALSGLSVVYAQTAPLQIAQDQSNASSTFSNEQLTASNANRAADLQNQVGGTIQSHKRLLDAAKQNLNTTSTKLDLAKTSYRAVNLRFLH